MQNDNTKFKTNDVIVGSGNLVEKGVYANRDFGKGEVVI